MSVTAIGQPQVSARTARAGVRSSRVHGVRYLQWFAWLFMLIPSTTVIHAVGASAYPASLTGIFVFFVYVAMVLFGHHNPLRHRSPVQIVVCLLWLSAL